MIELLVNNCEKYCIILCETAGDCHVTAQHWEIVMSPFSTVLSVFPYTTIYINTSKTRPTTCCLVVHSLIAGFIKGSDIVLQ